MKKVLLVDPSRAFAEFVKVALTRLGYRVLHVPDGETAQYLVHSEVPDMVLTETSLPGIGGVDLCRRIRDIAGGSGVPLVAVTRNGSEAVREAALAAGVSRFITKPVSARTLHELLQELLPFSPRRKAIRARMAVTAAVLGGSTRENLRTLNIGENGLFLEKGKPHPVGTRLFITLPLPNLRNPLTFSGVVAHSIEQSDDGRRAGMGVRFTDLDPNTTTLFTHYMENYVSGFLRGRASLEGAR